MAEEKPVEPPPPPEAGELMEAAMESQAAEAAASAQGQYVEGYVDPELEMLGQFEALLKPMVDKMDETAKMAKAAVAILAVWAFFDLWKKYKG